MHDVTPSVVPSAVRIDIRICTINFQVSFFILLYLLIPVCSCRRQVATARVGILTVLRFRCRSCNFFWLTANNKCSKIACRFRASDFCALGRLQILSGLKTNFRCLRRSVVPHHRQCKCKKLSMRFANLRTKIFRAATPVTVLQCYSSKLCSMSVNN